MLVSLTAAVETPPSPLAFRVQDVACRASVVRYAMQKREERQRLPMLARRAFVGKAQQQLVASSYLQERKKKLADITFGTSTRVSLRISKSMTAGKFGQWDRE